nr:astacin-like metalloprotease toxin 5 [Parasteatoda tepidariorum]
MALYSCQLQFRIMLTCCREFHICLLDLRGATCNCRPDLFDGDILGVKEMLEDERNGIRPQSYRWPNGVIPYYIHTDINDVKRSLINDAIAYYRRKTCIRFVPRTDEDHFLYIHNGTGCNSLVGRHTFYRQPQPVSLADGCHYIGTILHELLHAIGFFHEHQRNDRDDYVEIHLENVDEGDKSNFIKVTPTWGILYDKFDYKSIMVYESTAWSNNGEKTIVPLQEGIVLKSASTKTKLAKSDIRRINKMYHCQV